jgi:PIN domain nuclease of toxin-antitoxin system
MTLLDAYALVALIADEPAAEEVDAILREGQARIVIVNMAEAVDISQRTHGLPRDEIRAALEPLLLGRILSSVGSDEPHAWLAADLRAQHYDRRTRALSLADCFLIAHALTDGGPIATSDSPLAGVAREMDVEVRALANSDGERP